MNVLELFKPITVFVFDVDGVLTDGSVILLDNGQQARTMNVKDGLALQMALQNGYRVVVVSGGSSAPVIQRMKYLGIEEVHIGLKDKVAFLEDFLAKHNLSWNEVLYMGDDLPDVPVLEMAGLPCCPADAVPEVKSVAKYVSPVRGGAGAARDVIEKVLRLKGQWNYRPTVTSK